MPGIRRLDGWTLPDPPTARVRTDDAGRYRLPLPSRGVYTVRASAGDGAVASVDVKLETLGLVLVADLRISAGRETLRGRAVHSDGSPFRGSFSSARCPTCPAPVSFDRI